MSRDIGLCFEDLTKAAQKGNLEFFRKAASNFPENWLIKKCNTSGDNIIHLASRFGRLDVLKFISQELLVLHSEWTLDTLNLFESINVDRKTPLHEAAQNNHPDCVQFLLNQHVNVDSMKKADWTPLMLASAKKNKDVVVLLLNSGANPALVNKDGWNSFHIASREGQLDIVKLLLDNNPKIWKVSSKNQRTPLHTAALHGCEDVTRWLLRCCLHPVDVIDTCGTTPLMDAIRAGHIDVADIMIKEFKADIRKADKIGHQLLHIAAENGFLKSVMYLLTNIGMEVTAISPKNVSPLHLAAKEGHSEIVDCLISHGINVNLADDLGRTALHMAASGQHTDCIRILLQNGAVDSKDTKGLYARDFVRTQSAITEFQ